MCACAQTPALRGESRCARRSARRDQAGRVRYPGPTPPKPPARLGRSQGRGCATQATQTGATCPDGWRRPREAAGPPPYGGQRRPSTYAATGTGRQALQGWRSHRRSRLRPCKDWWAVLRLARAQPPPKAADWIEGGAGADPRATFVERAKRAEPARRPAARVGRGRPAGRGVRAAAARQQGAPLPCSGYCPVGPCKRAACAQPGRACWIWPGGAACPRGIRQRRRPADPSGRRIGGDLVPPALKHSPAWSFPGAGAYQFNAPDPLRSRKEKCPGASTDTWAWVHMAIAFFMGWRWLMKGFSASPSDGLLVRLRLSTPFLMLRASDRPAGRSAVRTVAVTPCAVCDIRQGLRRLSRLRGVLRSSGCTASAHPLRG